MFQRVATTVVAIALSTATVNAHETGDILIRAGIATVKPTGVSSADIIVPGIPSSEITKISRSTRPVISFTYMFTDNLGVEGLLGLPFEHDIGISGGANLAGIYNLGSTKSLPETITLQYYPMNIDSDIQPYIGIGVNYTIFFDSKISSQLNESPVGESKLDVDNSFALAGQVGIDYNIDENLFLNMALWYIDLETNAKLKTTNAGGIDINSVKVNPFAMMLAIGYRF